MVIEDIKFDKAKAETGKDENKLVQVHKDKDEDDNGDKEFDEDIDVWV